MSNISYVKIGELTAALNKGVQHVNLMIDYQKSFNTHMENIAEYWKGGGKTNSSNLYKTFFFAGIMYSQLTMGIGYGMQIIASIKNAGEVLMQAFSGDVSYKIKLHDDFAQTSAEFYAKQIVDYSSDNMVFDAENVATNVESICKLLENYLANISSMIEVVLIAEDSGLGGPNLAKSFQNFINNILEVVDNLKDYVK